MKLLENDEFKAVKSKKYNYFFNKKTGFFARWGETKEDDPIMAPSCEILDLEISAGNVGTKEEICKGFCKFCYKSNNEGSEPIYNMTFEEFKTIFHKVNKEGLLSQIAFGIMNISTNPDFFKMMEYSRKNGVIPNYTCHGLDVTDEIAKKTSELCGAVAVSIVNKEKTYDAIKRFSIDYRMKQTNLHFMLSNLTYDNAFNVIDDMVSDPRLKNMNAIVFLQYKHKNKKSPHKSIVDVEKYTKLINYCDEKKINYGFDSCSANLYIESIKDKKNSKELEISADPCESFLMSAYISCKGISYPCSFVEGIEEGIDVLHCNDFIKDVWNNEKSIKWRKKLLKNNRNCPIYNLNFKEK